MDALSMVVAVACGRFRYEDRPPSLMFVEWQAVRHHTIYEKVPYTVWSAWPSGDAVHYYQNSSVPEGWQ